MQALFPTVVSCAGCRWVKARVGIALVSRAKVASSPTTVARALAQQIESVPHQHQIGVVRDEGRRRSQMKDAAGFTRLLGEMPEMGDHVVPSLTFDLRHAVEVQVWSHLLQTGDLFLGDRQAQLPLAIGQCDPELSPHARSGGETKTTAPSHERRSVRRGDSGEAR